MGKGTDFFLGGGNQDTKTGVGEEYQAAGNFIHRWLKESQAAEIAIATEHFQFPTESHIQQIDSNHLWSSRPTLQRVLQRTVQELQRPLEMLFDGSFLNKEMVNELNPDLSSTLLKLNINDIRLVLNMPGVYKVPYCLGRISS